MDVRYFPWKTREIFKGGTATTVKKVPKRPAIYCPNGQYSISSGLFQMGGHAAKIWCLPKHSSPKKIKVLFSILLKFKKKGDEIRWCCGSVRYGRPRKADAIDDKSNHFVTLLNQNGKNTWKVQEQIAFKDRQHTHTRTCIKDMRKRRRRGWWLISQS